jgi:hypothetical protein
MQCRSASSAGQRMSMASSTTTKQSRSISNHVSPVFHYLKQRASFWRGPAPKTLADFDVIEIWRKSTEIERHASPTSITLSVELAPLLK